MSVITQRAFTRNEYRTPIQISDPAASEFQPGEMINSSVGGMAFLTKRKLKPGDGILIQIVDIAPDPYWPEAQQDYAAEVRWCARQEGDSSADFQVGVRFIVETCRLCDTTIYHATASGELVCDDCLKRICRSPDGVVWECVEKYLIGNVL